MRLSANYLCPERRSDDGRTILEGTRTAFKSGPDLQFLVELSGLEPLTSCMPYPARLSETGAGLGGCLCRVYAAPSRTELVGVARGCQAGARSWAFGTLTLPGREEDGLAPMSARSPGAGTIGEGDPSFVRYVHAVGNHR